MNKVVVLGLVFVFVALYNLSLTGKKVEGISPLEKIVMNNNFNQDSVVYFYMYKSTDDYKAIARKNLNLCSSGKIKYLAVSTFDEMTESEFLSVLESQYSNCFIVFYGTDLAVNVVRGSFNRGVFVKGDLSNNESVKLIYDDAIRQAQ